MRLPNELIELLGRPVPDIDRVVLIVRPGSRFRWLVLLEGAIVVLSLVFIIPVLILAVVALFGGVGGGVGGGGDGDVSSSKSSGRDDSIDAFGLEPGERGPIRWFWTSRFTLPTLEVELRVLSSGGEPIHEQRITLADSESYQHLLGATVRMASLQRCRLVEKVVVRGVSSTISRFDGGRPLCSVDPGPIATLSKRLPDGCSLTSTDTSWTLIHDSAERTGAGQFFLAMLASPVAIVIAPRWTRRVLGEGWRDLTRVPARRTTVQMRADSLRVSVGRGARIEVNEVFSASDLCAFDTAVHVTREPTYVLYGSLVRIVGHRRTVYLPADLYTYDRAVDNVLSACMRDLWARHPEAAPAVRDRPVRCRSCGETFLFVPGSGCTSCGSPVGLVDLPVDARSP
ncbi:MAG: hypothetical protein ACI9MC_000548 [Kiritimatiellia bacterium]|jgi:hypothetical protein